MERRTSNGAPAEGSGQGAPPPPPEADPMATTVADEEDEGGQQEEAPDAGYDDNAAREQAGYDDAGGDDGGAVDPSAFETFDDGAVATYDDGAGQDGGDGGQGGAPFDPVAAAIQALPATLVQYGDPIILDEDETGNVIEQPSSGLASTSAAGRADGTAGGRHPLLPVFRQQAIVLSETPVVTSTERVLHALLPPREYSIPVEFASDGRAIRRKRLVQPVSNIDATRQQLAELREVLDFKLKDAKARQSGLCPVRRAVFTMLFDELLRQVTINCAERGLLLLRIRDQLRMTYDAQSALYESSLQETRRRIFEATKSRPELMSQVDSLTDETDALRKEVRRLEAQHVALLRAADEQTQADSKKHGEELLFMERTKQRLTQHIERVKELYEEERRKMRGETA